MILAKKYLGKTIKFISGNYEGLTGKVIDIRRDNDYIYGLALVVKLSDSRTISIQNTPLFCYTCCYRAFNTLKNE